MQATLVGLQHPHAMSHLATLQQLSEVESIAVCGESRADLERVKDRQGAKVTAWHTDLGALLDRCRPFFAIVCVRNDRGPASFSRVLEAGVHLMAEKPIGRNAAETQQVLDTAAQGEALLSVCYQTRSYPVFRRMRSILREGLLGELLSVEVRALYTQVKDRNPRHWLFNKEHAGGGVISWLGCHDLDRIRFITGEDYATVSAQVATRSGEDIDVEDMANLSLTLESGMLVSMHLGYVLGQSGSGYHNPAGNDVYLGVNGRLGRMYVTGIGLGEASRLYVETLHPAWNAAPRRTFEFEIADSPAYCGVAGENFIRSFVHAAQGRAEPLTTGEDALHVARVMDAAYASSETGRRIALV